MNKQSRLFISGISNVYFLLRVIQVHGRASAILQCDLKLLFQQVMADLNLVNGYLAEGQRDFICSNSSSLDGERDLLATVMNLITYLFDLYLVHKIATSLGDDPLLSFKIAMG